jgi:hypothetical protein
VKSNDGKQVIVTEAGETIKKPEGMPDELWGLPKHDWRSKAFELQAVSNRRRAIIRKLVRKVSVLKSPDKSPDKSD